MHLKKIFVKEIKYVLRELFRDLEDYVDNVNLDKSKENVFLSSDGSEVDFDFTPTVGNIRKRNEIKKFVGKIVNRCLEITGKSPLTDKNPPKVGNIVITLPEYFKGNTKAEKIQFFKYMMNFFTDRYGIDNVIGGVIHFDETTPHMHVTIVPECESRKTNERTVSVASRFDRTELKKLHSDCDNYIKSVYGVEGLINNHKTKGATKDAKNSIHALKNEILDGIESWQRSFTSLQCDYEDMVNEKNIEIEKLEDELSKKPKTVTETVTVYQDSPETVDEVKRLKEVLDSKDRELDRLRVDLAKKPKEVIKTVTETVIEYQDSPETLRKVQKLEAYINDLESDYEALENDLERSKAHNGIEKRLGSSDLETEYNNELER